MMTSQRALFCATLLVGLVSTAGACGIDTTGLNEEADGGGDATSPGVPRDAGHDGALFADHFIAIDHFTGDAPVSADAPEDSEASADATEDAPLDAPVADVVTDAPHDAPEDSLVDAGIDAGFDAGIDAGFDAGIDAGIDAGNCGQAGQACCASGNPCAGDATCNGGACECKCLSVQGTDICADLTSDPLHCGQCGTVCSDDQACIGSACVCRPGLTSCSNNAKCVDLQADGSNCGMCGAKCQNYERCITGSCKAMYCSLIGETDCNGGCFTNAQIATDPRNCGGCGNACATNEICASGGCVGFFTADTCMTCPCGACTGVNATCCAYPSTTNEVCIVSGGCP